MTTTSPLTTIEAIIPYLIIGIVAVYVIIQIIKRLAERKK